MQNNDIRILAESIRKHRDSALGYAAIQGNKYHEREQAEAIEHVARTFARFSSVDEKEFLKMCSIA